MAYDQIGRVFQEVDATKHGVQYSYNSHGYMEKIAEATDTTKKYKQIETVNAWGSETQSMLGNGLKVQSTYHATTGLPDRVLVTNPLTQTIQDNTYAYNDIGILTTRSRFMKSNGSTLSETFHYDELNRLTQATATGLPTQSFQYDIKGNITSKSDVGTYTYGAGSAGPHAVTTAGSDNYTYDATGNMLTGGGRTVTYNTFRKPLTLSKGIHTSTFTYGPDRSHYKRVDADGTTVKTTLSIGNVEFITHSSGVTETKRYIGDIAVVTTASNASPSTQYLHKDTLGSTDIVTNAVGSVVAEMSFDAFGKRRNVLTLAELAEAQYDVLNAITTKGFTGHEMVDEVGIIHMGGRIYDPELGRFMSADPIVQSISNAQNLNRYSYVLNNPLSLVDPSGFRSKRPSGGKITTIVVTGESTSRNDCQWYEGGCWIGDQIGYEELIFGEGGSGGEDPVNNAEPDFEALRQETKIAISLAMIKATKEIDIVTLDQICGESGVVCGADVIAQVSPGASTGSNTDLGDGDGNLGIEPSADSLGGTNAGFDNPQVQEALGYLSSQSPTFVDLLAEAVAGGVSIAVDPTAIRNEVDELTNTIIWNPTQGLAQEMGITSPALMLAHELAHSVSLSNIGVDQFLEDLALPMIYVGPATSDTTGSGGSFKPSGISIEETRATDIQNKIARELNEVQRRDYNDGKAFPAPNVTYNLRYL
ncbi:MAG: RHS repeat-associated core domain-containing protein [Gammaproteobacteria bacterium]|nr:RHS repeat-associated core domain-containing protein [Gammaproteobacteria bacterium]